MKCRLVKWNEEITTIYRELRRALLHVSVNFLERLNNKYPLPFINSYWTNKDSLKAIQNPRRVIALAIG